MGGSGLLSGGTVRREMNHNSPPASQQSRTILNSDLLSPLDSEYILSQYGPGSGSTVDNNAYESYTVDEPVSVEDLKVHDIIHDVIPKSLKHYFDACKTNLDEVVPATLKSWIEYKLDGIKTNAYSIQEDIISALSTNLNNDIDNETLNTWIRTEVESKLLKLVDNSSGSEKYLKNIINDAKNGNTNNMDQFIKTLGAIITCIIVDTIKDVTRSYVSTKKFSPEQLQQLFVHCNAITNSTDKRETRTITSGNMRDPNELISLLWWMRCDTMHDNICDRHHLTCLKQDNINNMILDCVENLEEHILLEEHRRTESQITKDAGADTGNSDIGEFIRKMKSTNHDVEDSVLRSAITCMSRMNKGAMVNTEVSVPDQVKQIPENKTINNAYGKQLDLETYSGINIIASQASALDAGVTERGAKEAFYFNANVLYNMGGGSLAVYQEYKNGNDGIIYIETTMIISDSTGSIIGQGRKRISYLKKHGDEYKFTGEALTLNRAAYGGWQDCLDRYNLLKKTPQELCSTQDYGNILVKFMLEKWIGDAYITLVLRLGQRGAGNIGKCIHINKLNTGGVNEALETEYAKQSGTMDDDSDTVTIKDIVIGTPAENIIELTNDRLAYGFFAYMSLLFPTDGIVGALLNSGQGHAMWYDNSSDSSDYSDKKMYIHTPSRFFPHANIDDNANSNSSDSDSGFSPKYSGDPTINNYKRSSSPRSQGEVSASQEEHKQFQAKFNNDTKGGKRRKRHSYKAKRTRRVRKSKRKSKRTRRSRRSKRKSKRTRRVRKSSRKAKTRRGVKK